MEDLLGEDHGGWNDAYGMGASFFTGDDWADTHSGQDPLYSSRNILGECQSPANGEKIKEGGALKRKQQDTWSGSEGPSSAPASARRHVACDNFDDDDFAGVCAVRRHTSYHPTSDQEEDDVYGDEADVDDSVDAREGGADIDAEGEDDDVGGKESSDMEGDEAEQDVAEGSRKGVFWNEEAQRKLRDASDLGEF